MTSYWLFVIAIILCYGLLLFYLQTQALIKQLAQINDKISIWRIPVAKREDPK